MSEPKSYTTLQAAILHSAKRTLEQIADETPDGETDAEMAAGATIMVAELCLLASKYLYLGVAIGLQQPAMARLLWEHEKTRSAEFIAGTEELVMKMRTAGDA